MCCYLVDANQPMLTIKISLVLAITVTTHHSCLKMFLGYYLEGLTCMCQHRYSHLSSGPSFQLEDSVILKDW